MKKKKTIVLTISSSTVIISSDWLSSPATVMRTTKISLLLHRQRRLLRTNLHSRCQIRLQKHKRSTTNRVHASSAFSMPLITKWYYKQESNIPYCCRCMCPWFEYQSHNKIFSQWVPPPHWGMNASLVKFKSASLFYDSKQVFNSMYELTGGPPVFLQVALPTTDCPCSPLNAILESYLVTKTIC